MNCDGQQHADVAILLECLAGKLRLRFESGRKRLDMRDVIHLELKLPVRTLAGKLTGDSAWTSISVTDLKGV